MTSSRWSPPSRRSVVRTIPERSDRCDGLGGPDSGPRRRIAVSVGQALCRSACGRIGHRDDVASDPEATSGGRCEASRVQCRLAIPDRRTTSVPRRDSDDAHAVLDVVQDDPSTPDVLGFSSGRSRLASQAAPAIARSPPIRNSHANTARCIKSGGASRLSKHRHLIGGAATLRCRA